VTDPEASHDDRALHVAGWGRRPHWSLYVSVFLVSAALLMLEVSLTRLFSYTIWYHFAYLTISVALLGFGSSGAIVAAWPDLLAKRGSRFLSGALLVAALGTTAGIAFLAQFPIEAPNLLLKPLKFSFSLFVYYVIVGAPFLLAGFAIGVPFAAYPERMSRLYFWDLLGAACGCSLVVLGIEPVGIPGVICAAAGLMIVAAAALEWSDNRRRAALAIAACAAAVFVVAVPASNRVPIRITSTKNHTFFTPEGPGTAAYDERTDKFWKWTPLSRVDAFGWKTPTTMSFWGTNGLSTSWQGDKPPVAALLMYDGSNGSEIYFYHGDVQSEFRMLEHHILRLPYIVARQPNVLAIGVGGGIDLFNAIKQGARHVTGAELQPETVNLLKNRLREFTGGFYDRDDVTLVASEGRHFVRKTDQTFDLVQITAVDTFAAQASGAYVLAESYLYTVEAMQDYIDHLSPDGLVTTVVGDVVIDGELPPLATRLGLIGYRALAEKGVKDPSRHIVAIGMSNPGSVARSESVMVKKSPFTEEELARIRSFCDENGFTVLYAPGTPSLVLSNVLGPDEAIRQKLLNSSWFNMEATRDGNPFFYNVGKWTRFSVTMNSNLIMPGSYIGQIVMVLMLVQSLVLGTLLVLLPLWRGARAGLETPRVMSFLAYFLALGIGFMFIEISFVQSFVLFLGSPTYALSVTIFALLLFSSIGSFASGRFRDRPEWALRRLSIIVAIVVVGYDLGLARLFQSALPLDLHLRILVAIATQMPIGLTLGMFMPLGIACISREHPRLVPWAWGINGVGSVIGTTLAVLLAMTIGFPAVAALAAVLYLGGTALLIGSRSATR